MISDGFHSGEASLFLQCTGATYRRGAQVLCRRSHVTQPFMTLNLRARAIPLKGAGAVEDFSKHIEEHIKSGMLGEADAHHLLEEIEKDIIAAQSQPKSFFQQTQIVGTSWLSRDNC